LFAGYAIVILGLIYWCPPTAGWNFCTKGWICCPHTATPAHCRSMSKYLHWL
jgi:hypothetical protein